MNKPIDIVITYVTDKDPIWRAGYFKYKDLEIKSGSQVSSNRQAFGNERSRDWEFLPYWFRCVEQNCPWVRYIWFVCQQASQVPDWLNTKNKKLKIVYHDQFIPKEFLPTFNPMVIKSFFFNITELADNFIESSDDMFFTGRIAEDMFFENDTPVDSPVIHNYSHKDSDNTAFDKIIKNKDTFLHEIYNKDYKYYFHHMPLARNKTFEKQFYKKYADTINESFKISKFRHANNLIWHMYTDAMKFEGKAITKNIFKNSECLQLAGDSLDVDKLSNKDIVVINDTEFITNFDKLKYIVLNWFKLNFPEKSSFELTDTCEETLFKAEQIAVDYAQKNKLNLQRNPKKAWMLFLSSDNYIYYVLNVYKQLLDTGTRYAVYCGCTKEVSNATMIHLGKCGIITYRLADDSRLSINLKAIRNWEKAFTKLLLFKNPLNLDKIVYLDSDLGIYHNIDELFEKPHLSAVIDGAPANTDRKLASYEVGKSVFCSGLIVWDFTVDDGTKLFNTLAKLPQRNDWHDQAVLNYVYQDWKDSPELHLSWDYGLMTFPSNFKLVKVSKDTMPSVIHFIAGQGSKTNMPFTSASFQVGTWGNLPIVFEYYKEMNENVKVMSKKYKFSLPEINLSNVVVPSSEEYQKLKQTVKPKVYHDWW